MNLVLQQVIHEKFFAIVKDNLLYIIMVAWIVEILLISSSSLKCYVLIHQMCN